MRRMLLGAAPLLPFSVGSSSVATSGSATTTNALYVSATNPAPRSGTLSSATLTVSNAGTLYLVTGALSGSTFTVTATQALTVAAGKATYSVSCAINAGDLIGVWSASVFAIYATSGGAGLYAASRSSVPSGTITGLSLVGAANDLAAQATGT